MLKNYLLTAWRHIRRQPGYATINILGLAIGLGVCLLIGVYVVHERSYDAYHAQADRTYRLIYAWEQGEETPRPPRSEFATWGAGAIAPRLAADFPEVEHAVRFSGGHTVLLGRGDRSFQEERYYFADSTVFDVFRFPLRQGNPTTALAAPNRIVLTASAARKYFGDADPMGQTMRLDNERTLTVTGVMADLPSNTHFAFDMLLSMTTFERIAPDYMFDSWGYVDFFTYVLLEEGRRPESLIAQLPAFVQRHIGDQLDEETLFLDLEPLPEAYLSPVGGGKQIGPKGNPVNLTIFTLIGLFVLGIACINFTNLATARSMERAKEVGVRKAIGARRAPLIGQFMTESVGMALCAMVIALGLVSFITPYVEALSNGALAPAQLVRTEVLGALLGLTVLTGLLAGAYPALVLSGFRPVTVLRGPFGHSQQGRGLRTGLVVAQFVISTLLLVGTLGVYHQLQFMQDQRLGFVEEQQLVIDYGHDATVNAQQDAIRRELAAHPAVRSVIATRSYPGSFRPDATTFVRATDGMMRDQTFPIYEIGDDFVDHFDLQMAAGRAYAPDDYPSDTARALIINEAAARLYGYAAPSEAIGQPFEQWGREGQVIGVVKDFHHESLHQAIGPLSLRLARASSRFFVLQLGTDRLRQTVDEVRARWAEFAPHRPFLYSFLDQTFDAHYRAEVRFGQLVGVFAGLALFVACLGLLGLAAFTTQQRTKEIGVRKVVGASVTELVLLLTKDIVRLLILAFVVALPLGYVGVHEWLEQFAYRSSLPVGYFIAACGVVLTVALLTVSYQTLRAARLDPVDALRTE